MGDAELRLQTWRIECEVGVQQQHHSPSILKVPNTLKRLRNDEIYTPQVISLGPYHFLTGHLYEMESKKTIISRFVESELPDYFSRPFQTIRAGGELEGLEWREDFSELVLTKCKDAYGDHAEFNGTLDDVNFSSMMFRDTSFLLLFLNEFVGDKEERRKDKSSPRPFDGLRSGEGLSIDVKMDVVKLENQIPLCVLEALYAFIAKPKENSEAFIANPTESFQAFVATKCSYYSPFYIESYIEHSQVPHNLLPNDPNAADLLYCIRLQKLSPHDVKATHLLHYIREISVHYRREISDESSKGFCYDGCSSIAWINEHLLFAWTKIHLVCNKFKQNNPRKNYDPTRRYGLRLLPSAVNLMKAGVKFRHFDGGIRHIRFDRKDGTLYLPAMKIGIMTETIVRNLIAFELCSAACEKKAVTGFVRLLDELIEGDKDVELLRTNEILVNWLGPDEKVASMLKSLRSSTWKPYFKPINDARSNLCKFYESRKWHILWNEFLETYCSKPWVLISAIAATALLLMTFAQVFCLFYTCNP